MEELGYQSKVVFALFVTDTSKCVCVGCGVVVPPSPPPQTHKHILNPRKNILVNKKIFLTCTTVGLALLELGLEVIEDGGEAPRHNLLQLVLLLPGQEVRTIDKVLLDW
jgi:hypothetical protein